MTKSGFLEYLKFVRTATRRLVAMIPEDQFNFRPQDNMFSIKELANHFIFAESMTRNGIVSDDWNPDTEEQMETVDAVVKLLDQTYARTLKAMKEFPEGKFLNKDVNPPGQPAIKAEVAFMGLILHEVHHRTQLFLYLKTLGLPLDSSTLFMP